MSWRIGSAAAVVLLAGIAVWWFWPSGPERPTPAGAEQSVTRFLSGEEAAEDYPRITGPEPLRFPRDHGAHPEYRHEWWYLTGQLETVQGRHFGYQITFFRFNLDPRAPERDSAWGTNQAWMAHLGVTDTEAERFRHRERFARGGAIGLAGAEVDPFRVWLEDWVLEGASGEDIMPLHLRVEDDELMLDLRLEALKPLVLQGDAGYSRKGPEPGNASRYYSYTRLATEGELVIDGQRHAVQGLSWMDREWGSSVLSEGQVGWDWFSLQLDDQTEIMYYTLRRDDGSVDPRSKGLFVAADGSTRLLEHEAVELEALRHWESPLGDARYPVAWRMRIPSLGLELDMEAVLDDQELRTGFRYWEGAVTVRGEREGRGTRGRGYAELTGYEAGPQ
ncbi:MAG: carotenoid 1,2-hydratase [Ectothiorhodospiraceae bacterium]|nr:carotenoid 1,2-hydratase [Ectothiorhodospiraceae bacterium]